MRQHGTKHRLAAHCTHDRAENRRQSQKSGESCFEALSAEGRELLRRTSRNTKRKSTCGELSCCGIVDLGSAMMVARGSGKVVATHCVAHRRPNLRHRRQADRARDGGAPGFNEREHYRQRQDFVTGLCDLIEAKREPRLAGERAEPFAVLVDEATERPVGQLELDKPKCCIGPSAGLDQPIDSTSCRGTVRSEPRTRLRGHIGQKIGRERVRTAKPFLQLPKAVLVFRIEQHDTISNGSDLCGITVKMDKAP
jgi:hypothetical protein